MEDIFDIYTAKHSEEETLICMDEAALGLEADEFEAILLIPGKYLKEKDRYE